MFEINEKFIVLDTETANSLDDPLCYDIGFAILSIEEGVIETHSYVVADIFLDKELMDSAYFKDKIPTYWEDIIAGKRVLARFKTIRHIFKNVCEQYGITKVIAHNARFDYRSVNLTQRFLTSSKWRYFFPYGIEIYDILKLARGTFKNNNKYKQFCINNNYLTQNGQHRLTAEIIYRYLTNNNNFIESHTGLEDVIIEAEILITLYKENPDFDFKLW